jgi:hypothetical protein
MKFVAKVTITAICCIAAITCVGILCGHDSTLITGATSAIVGIAAGVVAYYKGKSKGTAQSTNKIDNPN